MHGLAMQASVAAEAAANRAQENWAASPMKRMPLALNEIQRSKTAARDLRGRHREDRSQS